MMSDYMVPISVDEKLTISENIISHQNYCKSRYIYPVRWSINGLYGMISHYELVLVETSEQLINFIVTGVAKCEEHY